MLKLGIGLGLLDLRLGSQGSRYPSVAVGSMMTIFKSCLKAHWAFLPGSKCLGTYKTLKSDTSLYNFSFDDSESEEQYICKDYSSYLSGNEFGRKVALKKIQNLFKCSRKTASTIIKNTPGLTLISSDNLSKKFKNALGIGLQIDVVMHNPWLLTFNQSELSTRLALVRQMQLNDINEAVTLLRISLDRLRELSHQTDKDKTLGLVPERSRIQYLIETLKCPVSDVCQAVANHIFLQTLPLERIKSVLDVLLGYGVASNDIIKDVWVFRYNPLTIEARLKMAQDAGVQRIRPWIVRCKKSAFSNTLQRRVESRNTLGTHASVVEYLSQRLDCSLESVTSLSHRYPPFLKVHVTKLKEVLDYLFEEGFSPQQVYQVPRILCHSLETTQERLNEIRNLQHNPSSLIVLCKSKRQYSDYLNKLKSYKKQKHLQVKTILCTGTL